MHNLTTTNRLIERLNEICTPTDHIASIEPSYEYKQWLSTKYGFMVHYRADKQLWSYIDSKGSNYINTRASMLEKMVKRTVGTK